MQLYSRTISDSALILQHSKPSHNFAVLTRLFKKPARLSTSLYGQNFIITYFIKLFLTHALDAQSCQMWTLKRQEEWKECFWQGITVRLGVKMHEKLSLWEWKPPAERTICWATKFKTRKDVSEKWRKRHEEAIVKSIIKNSSN